MLTYKTENPKDVDRAAVILNHLIDFGMKLNDEAGWNLDASQATAKHALELWTQGGLVLISASKDGKIVGLQLWVKSMVIFLPHLNIFYEQLIWVEPEYRGFGKQFLDFAQKEIAKICSGPFEMKINTPVNNPNIPKLESCGFDKTHVTMTRKVS